MDIQRIAPVEAHGHTRVVYLREQTTLTVSEPRPRRSAQARQLHVVEGHRGVVPIRPPTSDQQFEQPFVCLEVVGIRLALIPDYAPDRVVVERQNARFEEVARLIGMAFVTSGRAAHVSGGPLARPLLDEIILQPVGEDVRECALQRMTVDPGFGRRTPDRIADNPDGYLQAVLQHPGKGVAYGREAKNLLPAAGLPDGRSKVFQPGHRIRNLLRPSDVVGLPASLHVE